MLFRSATDLPVLVGSGVTTENLTDIFALADAVIIGSSIKLDGNWANALDATRCRDLVKAR